MICEKDKKLPTKKKIKVKRKIHGTEIIKKLCWDQKKKSLDQKSCGEIFERIALVKNSIFLVIKKSRRGLDFWEVLKVDLQKGAPRKLKSRRDRKKWPRYREKVPPKSWKVTLVLPWFWSLRFFLILILILVLKTQPRSKSYT